VNRGLVFDTLYFGGGTPSLLWREVAEITAFLRESGGLAPDAEVTAEANPSDITREMLTAWLASGINRVSIGAQSLDGGELAFLTRRHGAQQSVRAASLAAEAGFANISVDLMLGLPMQTAQSIADFVNAFGFAQHISAYMLTVKNKKIPVADEEQAAELYLFAVESLNKSGFSQYEISNFAKPGFQCRHNLKYWNCVEYVGIGPAAHSYYGGTRFAVDKNIETFIKSPLQETYVTEPEPADFAEYAMMRLRLTDGLPFAECEKRGVSDIRERAKLIPPDLIKISDSGIALTAKGFLVSNEIITTLL